MALSDFIPEYTQDDVKKDATKPQLKPGTYRFRVLKASTKVNDKGNMCISTYVAPVDTESGNVKSPGANLTLTGPFRTPPGALAEAGLPADAQKAGAPKTAFIIQQYAQARKNAEHPFEIETLQRIRKVNGAWVVVDAQDVPTGEEAESKESRQSKAEAIADAARQFYLAAWKDCSMLVGDEFYGKVEYKPDSSFDGPQIKVLENQDPTTLDLTDTSGSLEV